MKKYRIHGKAWQNRKAFKIANENWTLAHEIVSMLRGDKCQIPKCKRGRLQLDHVITRNCKNTFFEIDNLGYLCAEHHTEKSFNHGGVIDNIVREICRRRMGEERFQKMIEDADQNCEGFRTVVYQEQKNIELKEYRAELLTTVMCEED